MMKKVIRTTPTPKGTLLEFADGSSEELVGVSASLSGSEDDDESEDSDDQESMMSELKSQRQI